MNRLFFLLLCFVATHSLVGQRASLLEHLQEASIYFDYRLVYSPGSIPDTSFAFERPADLEAKQVFERLTIPFKLRAILLGRQIIVTTETVRRFSASGFIEDAITGERLVGANVSVLSQNRGVISNGYGYFSVSGLKDGEQLVISYVGYPSDTLLIRQGLSAGIEVRLRPSYLLSVVEISAKAKQYSLKPVGTRAFSPSVLEPLELTVGDRDLNAWLAQLPGVQTSPGGFRGYALRGADPTHNLVLVDDATLYLPSHAAGFASFVPGDAIRSIKLFKHAGPVRYGDRVGGVLDIRLKEGSQEGRKSMFSVGVSDVRASTEGPVFKGSYYLSARRGLTDFWLQALRPSVQTSNSRIPNINFLFYDLTGKLNLPLKNRQRLYASVYVGRDRYQDEDQIVLNEVQTVNTFLDQSVRAWRNAIGSIRHNAAVGSKLFINTTATISEFNYDAGDFFLLTSDFRTAEERFTYAQSFFGTNLLDLGFKQDYDFAFKPALSLNFGVDVVSHRFRVGTRTQEANQVSQIDNLNLGIQESVNDLPQLNTYDASTYIGGKYHPSEDLEVDFGLRLSSQLGEGETFMKLLPRVSLDYLITQRVSVNATLGEARQYIHSISTLNPGLPRDLWVPSVAGLKPQESKYASLGFVYVSKPEVQFSATGYYQQFSGLARFSDDFASLSLGEWVDNLRRGTGKAYGLEMAAEIPLKSFKLNLNYTYSKATRIYEDEIGELQLTERFRLDRRHLATVAGSYNFNKLWAVGFNWQVGSGLPARIPGENAVGPTIPATNVPLTNNWRYSPVQTTLKPYHSLDLGARKVYFVDGNEFRLSFGVQNIYFRKNPLFLNLRRKLNPRPGESVYEFTQVSMLPFLPFARYSVIF